MKLGLMTAKFENFSPLEMNSCFISTSDTAKANSCLICDSATVHAGIVRGVRTPREFSLRQCSTCGFAFVENPWTDYARIYDNAYYEGHGSDPLIDYAFEFRADDSTVRAYEWRGWDRLVHRLKPGPLKWLDFGCGCGTLVRYIAAQKKDKIFGFDQGAWAVKARAAGVPILTESELAAHEGSFDIITAIDVIEHVVEPSAMLEHCRRLLKPGGILIPITGNAETAPKGKLANWSYVSPEIHVSFFTPDAMGRALIRAGFAPRELPRSAGWRDIIRARILKNLRVKRRTLLERLAPWGLLSPLADALYRMGRMPIGEAV
jgi:SAM-dependent methyltransferase